MFELTGQTAIVTGGASGIGEAIARRLSSAGVALSASRDGSIVTGQCYDVSGVRATY
jgi:NAD(P)-dependent dehydrogenase (short-subunit alcohol dehydrogenase family)